MKLLFICKKRMASYGISFGLLNSAKFVCNALIKNGIECKVVSVVDNNCIDKEVHLFKPTHVIIEAYWVVPSKFDILCKKYPNIKWIIRGHSKIPFFANEGISMKWTAEYIQNMKKYNNLYLSFNDKDTCDTIYYGFDYLPIYLPNIYSSPLTGKLIKRRKRHHKKCHIDIGCFGAIRPMKNTLQQAFASIKFADKIGKKLRFHVNSGRVEQKGESVIKNLIALFDSSKHELICHEWLNHRDFIRLIGSMDMGIQVSLSESFNIVGADFVYNDILFVGTKDMKWMSFLYRAEPTDINDIVNKMKFSWFLRHTKFHYINKFFLHLHNIMATSKWLFFIKKTNRHIVS